MVRLELEETGMVPRDNGQYVLAQTAFNLQAQLEDAIRANGKLLDQQSETHLELFDAYEMIAKLAAKLTELSR